TMPDCNTDAENAIVDRARRLTATYEDMAELIRLGAYRGGSDADVDEAIRYHGAIEGFLDQRKHERSSLDETYRMLAELLDMAPPTAPEATADAPPAADAVNPD
ncbi:MAG: flagellum-specific ATP synthase FliI, partial [Rhodospirillales bacterium]|nr:flagellum-specific ATP synthase FliI [Rhodospirillales bacterium]